MLKSSTLALLLSNMFCYRDIKLTISVVRTTIAIFVMTAYKAVKGQRDMCAGTVRNYPQSSVSQPHRNLVEINNRFYVLLKLMCLNLLTLKNESIANEENCCYEICAIYGNCLLIDWLIVI